MTLEDNINRVRELLAQRDEIDRELGNLIGDQQATAPSEKPAKRGPRVAKQAPKKNANS
jgi:hypothetical protein